MARIQTVALKLVREVRDRVVFLAVTPLWAVGLAACALIAAMRRQPVGAPVSSCARRWAGFLLGGLRDLRREWWVPLQFERWRDVLRYALLLEVASLWNLAEGPSRPPNSGPGKRVLLVKLGHLGDILHTVPLAREWRRRDPGVKIDLLTGPWSAGVAGRYDAFGRVIAYAPHIAQFHRGQTDACLSLAAEWRFLLSLRRERYDLVISTSPPHPVDLLIELAAAPSVWRGVPCGTDLYPAPWLRETRAFESRRREADWVAGFIDGGAAGLDTSLAYPLVPDAVQKAKALIVDAGGRADGSFAVVAPGAGWPGKCWPPERFAAVGDVLGAEFGLGVVLVGSRGEQELADAVRRQMSASAVNLAGRTDLDTLAGVLRLGRLFIGNDSGPLHMAAALGVRTVSFFGPTFPDKWAPPGAEHLVFAAGEPCDGCWYWHFRAGCVHEGRCMKSISAEDVVNGLRRKLLA
jgi:ADP-heptose:LPS heptosyltransferase